MHCRLAGSISDVNDYDSKTATGSSTNDLRRNKEEERDVKRPFLKYLQIFTKTHMLF